MDLRTWRALHARKLTRPTQATDLLLAPRLHLKRRLTSTRYSPPNVCGLLHGGGEERRGRHGFACGHENRAFVFYSYYAVGMYASRGPSGRMEEGSIPSSIPAVKTSTRSSCGGVANSQFIGVCSHAMSQSPAPPGIATTTCSEMPKTPYILGFTDKGLLLPVPLASRLRNSPAGSEIRSTSSKLGELYPLLDENRSC